MLVANPTSKRKYVKQSCSVGGDALRDHFFWETDFYPSAGAGEEWYSPYEAAIPQPSTGYKLRTYGSRNVIQYWGWVLQKGSYRHFQTPVLYWRNFSLRSFGRKYFLRQMVVRIQMFTPHHQPQKTLLRFLFAIRSRMEFLPRRTWCGQKPLPLQFPELSLP